MRKKLSKEKAFQNIYQGKRVLVTGHTGFKGAWLTLWLTELGAEVAGFSKYLPSEPCLFKVLGLKKKIKHYQGDVRNLAQLQKVFHTFKPQVVFHLAAQPLVRMAYNDPKLTFDTNVGGTVNVLECIRNSSVVKAAVIITSDKCYENLSIQRGYHEADRLGGEDPYSASKACAEIAFSSYSRSFFTHQGSLNIATARAGNVIGGGDWAKDRIIPDCVRAWSKKKTAIIRNPKATRPWQHVLEPLSGYLWLGANLLKKTNGSNGESFNFGPRYRASHDVQEVVDLFLTFWGDGAWHHVAGTSKKEAMLLQLSPLKTLKKLNWTSTLSFKETIELTARWYQEYYSKETDILDFSYQQIDHYVKKAQERGQRWARG
jgi:CDP-glucose 4,6-dehydratase